MTAEAVCRKLLSNTEIQYVNRVRQRQQRRPKQQQPSNKTAIRANTFRIRYFISSIQNRTRNRNRKRSKREPTEAPSDPISTRRIRWTLPNCQRASYYVTKQPLLSFGSLCLPLLQSAQTSDESRRKSQQNPIRSDTAMALPAEPQSRTIAIRAIRLSRPVAGGCESEAQEHRHKRRARLSCALPLKPLTTTMTDTKCAATAAQAARAGASSKSVSKSQNMISTFVIGVVLLVTLIISSTSSMDVAAAGATDDDNIAAAVLPPETGRRTIRQMDRSAAASSAAAADSYGTALALMAVSAASDPSASAAGASSSGNSEKPRLIPLVAAESGYNENSSVNVLCTVSQGHHETLTFDWYKDGQLLVTNTFNNQQHQSALDANDLLDNGGDVFAPTKSKLLQIPSIEKHSDHSLLRIQRVNAQHSGRYTCLAKNQFGQDSSSVDLKVNGMSTNK